MSAAEIDPPAYLSEEREQELAEFAEWIADDYFPKTAIDPRSLAATKGITLSLNDYGAAFDGLLEYRSGQFHIYCNAARSRTTGRRRFTIAHELGHYFIDEHREALRSGRVQEHGSFCDFQSKNLVEREADTFASYLLMPKGRFTAAASRKPIGFATAIDLASTFDASRTSAAIRLLKLNSCACAIIKWQDGAYAWKQLSEEARRNGLRKTITDRAPVPSDSATGKALAGETPEGEFFSSVSTASTWFPFIAPGSARDVLLREEAIALGSYGVLTFIMPLEN